MMEVKLHINEQPVGMTMIFNDDMTPLERTDEMTTLYDYEALQKKAEYLDDIVKIIKFGGYDEVVYYRLQIYCEWKGLMEVDNDGLDYSEVDQIKEIIKND